MRMRPSVFVSLAVMILAVASGCAHKPETPANTGTSGASASGGVSDADAFKGAYGEAARELCAWSKKHQDAAQSLAQFATSNPDKWKEFLSWSSSHVEAINAFVATHAGWNDFVFADGKHVAAANAFLNWARKFPAAAQDLGAHPGAVGSSC
jgi:hypothetical protein